MSQPQPTSNESDRGEGTGREGDEFLLNFDIITNVIIMKYRPVFVKACLNININACWRC